MAAQRLLSPCTRCSSDFFEARLRNAESLRSGLQPQRRAFAAQRKGRAQAACAHGVQSARGIGEEGLGQQVDGVGSYLRHRAAFARWEKGHLRNTHVVQELAHLVFDHVGQRAHNQQLRRRSTWRGGL